MARELQFLRHWIKCRVGQIVKEDAGRNVEQMRPALTQSLFNGLFACDELVEAEVKTVCGSDVAIGIEQDIHGGLAEPALVNAEFTSKCA